MSRQLDTILGLRRLKVHMDKDGISEKIPHVASLIVEAEEALNVLNATGKTYRFMVLRGKDGYSTFLKGIADVSITDADDAQYVINVHQGSKTYQYIANLSVSPDNADALAFYKTGLKRFRGYVKTAPLDNHSRSHHHVFTVQIVDELPLAKGLGS